MGQWFSDNTWLLTIIGVVIVFMVVYMGLELHRNKRKRAAAAKAKRQGPSSSPTIECAVAKAHMDVGFADVGGRSVLTVTLSSDQDVKALGILMSLLVDEVDVAVVETGSVEAHIIRSISPGFWAVKSEVEEDWVALRTEDVLLRLEGSRTQA